ncbi:neurogenic locus notch homolog protein 1-like [Mercenaria mercenaria]|uniref:neurogenic locus notch homolog protein 1-like n=1 Tax=Mercenaria mercenaria TaxID=6596 RepID=UPI00234EECF0|nr:neurogenic locus notch homolog protein 1-like [Mercenaria mercenaria]
MIKVSMLRLFIMLLFFSTTSALQCLSCQNVPDKRDCHNLMTCGSHQECYTNRVIDGSRRNLYNLGCVDQYACSQLSQSGLGRREIRSTYPDFTFSNSDHKRSVITTCFQCCNNSDGCNLNTCGIALSPCATNPCVHGACSDESNNDFRCTCHAGYIGRLCDFQISPCASNPCAHGSCTNHGNGYNCTCDSGYTGTNCNHAISPCSPNPCVDGVCSTHGNGYTCTCASGYTGTNCDQADPCILARCVHGQCSSSQSSGFHCTCAAGYTGVLCDTPISSCASNPCVHGSCTNTGNGYACSCDVGYIGTNCDREIKDCKDIQNNNVASATGDNVYLVHLNRRPVNVVCDMKTLGGGWTVLMNRENGKQNFEDQDYSSYASGFGDIRENFWLGLSNMHEITGDGRRYQLRVELTIANGSKYIETYDDFSIGPAKDFVLHVGNYRGNAGDSLSGHNGFGFTNKDVDHDSNLGTNCGVYMHGAWWFHNCYDSCLTCPYLTPGTNKCRSFSWNSLGYCIAIKSARMMVRPM